MKRITCESCGSTDVIKEDDFYICKYCGSKYLADDVKKIIISSHDSTASFEQLLNRGNTFLKLKDFESAQNVFSEIIKLHPEKIIGYQEMIVSISNNFENRYIDKYQIVSLRDKILKLTKNQPIDTGTTNFLNKVENYLRWFDLIEKEEEKELEISQIDSKIQSAKEKEKNNKNNFPYFVIGAIIWVGIGIASGGGFVNNRDHCCHFSFCICIINENVFGKR